MFREIILTIFRSTRLCVTACGIMYWPFRLGYRSETAIHSVANLSSSFVRIRTNANLAQNYELQMSYLKWLLCKLDGPGIETRWGWGFPHPPKPALGPHTASCTICSLFPGGKAARAGRWPTTPSSDEVKGRVKLYLYSPSGT